MQRNKLIGFALGVALLTVGQSALASYDTVSPKSYTRLCPNWTGGDREYAGYGPDVTTAVTLRKNGALIQLDASMHQIETRDDWSEAQYDGTFTLTTARQGTTYNAIWAPDSNGVWGWVPIGDGPWQTYNEDYIDTNTTLHRTTSTNVSWLAEVDTNGDTNGLDIGSCTADDAYLNVRTNPIYVQFN